MTKDNKDSEKAKSFTTRVTGETWAKLNKYKAYGKWNTNQFTNHALDAFFEIIETSEANPKLPLVCETIRDMCRKSRSRLASESPVEPPEGPVEGEPAETTSTAIITPAQQMKERMSNVEKPWLNQQDSV
jgi:hypothetical protein